MEQFTSPFTPGITFSVEMVTPEMAADWLTRVKMDGEQRVQRSVKPRRVERYSSDMAQGQWPFTGDPVRFSDDGYFIDGQHRAEAIIDSGEPQPLLVVRGLPFSIMQQLDVGAPRTFISYLQMHGVKSPGDVSALSVMLWHWKTGKFGYRGLPRVAEPHGLNTDPTHAERWALYKRFPTMDQAVIRAREVYGRTNKYNIKRSQLGMLYVLFGEVDPYRRDAFFAELVRDEQPIDIQPGYPITVIRDRWGRQGASAAQQARSLEKWAWVSFMIKAWNAWYDGERIFQLTPGGSAWHVLPKIRGLVDTTFFEAEEGVEADFEADFDAALEKGDDQ